MATLLVAPGSRIEEAEARTRRRLIGVHGVRMIGAGLDGGRAYVEIAAHSVQAADFAEEALRSIASISDEEWLHGWKSIGSDLTLRIYPA